MDKAIHFFGDLSGFVLLFGGGAIAAALIILGCLGLLTTRHEPTRHQHA